MAIWSTAFDKYIPAIMFTSLGAIRWVNKTFISFITMYIYIYIFIHGVVLDHVKLPLLGPTSYIDIWVSNNCEQYHAFQEVMHHLEGLLLLSLPNSFMTILRSALDQNLVYFNLSALKGWG